MTSWIRAQPIPKKEEPERGFLFQTDATGFAAQFNQMFYAYLYAQKEGRALYVYDKTNALASNYRLLHSMFEDVSGLTFVEDLSLIHI